MKKHGAWRLAALLLTAALIVQAAQAAGIDKGFFKKVTKKVWALESENIFDPATPIPDSISAGQSGVIIARHDYLEVKRDEQNTIYHSTGRTNRTEVEHIRRSMVKLLDHSAVEYYSDFEFGGTAIRRDYGSALDAMAKNAFGARIHKADGRVIDIDPSTALEVSDGKKGGENKHFKIAIPSLEVGDVIEYFYYSKYVRERDDVCGLDMEISDRYPIMSRLISGQFTPELSSEFFSYNGAPTVTRIPGKNEITVRMMAKNIPGVAFDKFVYSERQLPFVRLNVINNYCLYDENFFIATTARRGGVHNQIGSAPIILEAKENIAYIAYLLWKSTKPISPIPSRALTMVKNYIKSHPGATPRQIADAAYLAVRYCNHTAGDDSLSSSFLLAMFMNDVMDHLETFPLTSTGIGIVNSRSEVPTDELSGWDQSNFVSCVGDSIYMMIPGFNIAPGELPGEFQGESGHSFLGRLREFTKLTPVNEFKVPDRKYSGNSIKTHLTVSLAPDAPSAVNVSRSVELSGSCKSLGADLVDNVEWLRGVEGYLGVEKPFKVKDYDVEDRDKELRNVLRDECEAVTGVKPDSVMSYRITHRGFLPGEDKMEYSSECRVSGLVEDLGGDISLTLGRLLGHVEKLEGSERERLLDAMLPTAFTHMHLLTLKVPQGYKVDETSLADFNRNTANPLGVFATNAKLNDEGDVEVQCVMRVKYATAPLAGWPMLRDLLDAGSKFADSSLVLVKQ